MVRGCRHVEYARDGRVAGGGAKPFQPDDGLADIGKDARRPGRQFGEAGPETCGRTDDGPALAHMNEGGREVVVDDGDDAVVVGVRPIGIVCAFWRALRRNTDSVRVSPASRCLAPVSMALFVVAEKIEAVRVTA